ncbi:MAG: T9SS type A sorting domain-containing protein, partial [Bacillota bacterium]
YSADPAIGSVDANGLFTSNGKPGQGYVYAELNGAKDSAYIYVKRIGRLDLTPKSTVVDANKSLAFNLKAYDPDNVQRTYITSEVQWKSSNPNVAVVDSLGNVIGKSEGTAKIIATIYGVVSDTATVTVQIGKGTTIMNGMEKLEDFSITGLNIDLNATKASLSTDKTEGTSSIKIDYKYTYDNTKSFGVFLDTKLPIYGIPDSLWIDTKTTDTLSQSRLYFILSDDNNELFRISAFGYINSLDKFTSIPVPMRSFAALGSGVFYYPAIITRFEIALQKSGRVNGQVYTGTIYLDNLRAKYPNSSTSVEAENGKLPESYYLGQNYPNPFNPSTVIEFSLPDNNQEVSLKVYDLLGREVAELVNGKMSAGQHKVLWNASQNASGVYFYRLQSGNYAETKKMMFIR